MYISIYTLTVSSKMFIFFLKIFQSTPTLESRIPRLF